MKYYLVKYVNLLSFANNDGSVVNYAKAIFIKETKHGRSLEIYRATRDLDVDGYEGQECTPYFDDKGRVIAIS